MHSTTQQCPLCAEDITRTATVCPYCGAKFAVTSNGYCTICHAVREADEAGLCKTCGNPVADWRRESQLVEESIPGFSPPAATAPAALAADATPETAGAQTANSKPHSRTWLYAVLGGVVLLAVIAAITLLGRDKVPTVTGLFTTPTYTVTLTVIPTLTPIPLPTSTPTLSLTSTLPPTPTKTPLPAWVTDFAEPLLAEIARRPPNVDEVFSGKYGRYAWNKDPGVSIRDGAMHMAAAGSGANVGNRKLDSDDFILQFDLTPQTIDSSGGVHVLFRHQTNSDHYCSLGFFQLRSWSITCGANSGNHEVASGKTPQILSGRTTRITFLVRGAEMALYLDDKPVGYGQDEAHIKGSGPNFNIYAPRDTTRVYIDNVKFWDLNHLLPNE